MNRHSIFNQSRIAFNPLVVDKSAPCNACSGNNEEVVVGPGADNSNTGNQISKDCGDIDAVSSSGYNHHHHHGVVHSGPGTKVISPTGADASKALDEPHCPIHNDKRVKGFTTTDELAKG